MYASQAELWNVAGIKRAAKAVADRQAGKPSCGYPIKLPRTDALFAKGIALRWEESDGRKMLAQVWSLAPYVRGYWLKVDERCAHFPGEMRLAIADADGRLGMDGKTYNARGSSRIHGRDGTECYGYQAPHGCPGCLAERVRDLAGRPVRVSVDGDPMYGQTVRWGTLREVQADVAIFDGYCDCNGVREYANGSYSGNGVAVSLSSIREIRAA